MGSWRLCWDWGTPSTSGLGERPRPERAMTCPGRHSMASEAGVQGYGPPCSLARTEQMGTPCEPPHVWSDGL